MKKINQASSGSMLKQTDLPFTIGNKMLFLLRGSISWMQGNYVKHLFGANYLLYLKSYSCMGKVQMWKSDFENGNLYQYIAYWQSVSVTF